MFISCIGKWPTASKTTLPGSLRFHVSGLNLTLVFALTTKNATCCGLIDSEMIEFFGMRLHCNDKVPKALSVGELPEHHRK